MKFHKYPIAEIIKKNIDQLGFTKPTDIQYKAIPQILSGKDVLAIAQTGTGKTAAFVIPILHQLYSQQRSIKTNLIRCVVMVPTRELAKQILEVFEQIGRKTGIQSLAILGGVEQDAQIDQLKAGIDILIATPGRLFDLQHQGYVNLQQLRILVLDEADLMLEKGFIKDIRDLLRFIPRNRQTLFFSATIDEKIKKTGLFNC